MAWAGVKGLRLTRLKPELLLPGKNELHRLGSMALEEQQMQPKQLQE